MFLVVDLFFGAMLQQGSVKRIHSWCEIHVGRSTILLLLGSLRDALVCLGGDGLQVFLVVAEFVEVTSRQPLTPLSRTRGVVQEMDIDFVAHGDDGPASAWAARAKPGSFLGFAGPSEVKIKEFYADWYLVAADMSALPVASAALEAMPRDAKGVAIFEIETAEDAQEIDAPQGVNIHWLVQGDPHVVRAAVAGRGDTPTCILAVTLLTSLDRDDLDANLMIAGPIAELVVERARRALDAGADGVIASPNEAAAIRALPEAAGRLIVPPGVRPAGAAPGDQKRTATPAEAIRAGADHIVVARPVIAADDPVAAAEAILADLGES